MPKLRAVLDGIVPSGVSSRRSSANRRRFRRAHGARLDKNAASTGPRCYRADDALPTARSVPRDAPKSSLATFFEQIPEQPQTTSTAMPAAPGIGLVSPDAPGRSDVSSCALRLIPAWWPEQRSVPHRHAVFRRLRRHRAYSSRSMPCFA